MTRGREQWTAPILSHGQTTSGQCGFNQAASHPADPIKRHRARRERSRPKAMLITQTSPVALDLLENSIGGKRIFAQAAGMSPVRHFADIDQRIGELAIDRWIPAALLLATLAGAAGCLKFAPQHKTNGAFCYLRERF
jgi:hypothetical protein